MADIIINTIPIHKTLFIFLLCGSYNFSRRIAGVGSASEESSEAGLQNGAVLSTLILFFSEKIVKHVPITPDTVAKIDSMIRVSIINCIFCKYNKYDNSMVFLRCNIRSRL